MKIPEDMPYPERSPQLKLAAKLFGYLILLVWFIDPMVTMITGEVQPLMRLAHTALGILAAAFITRAVLRLTDQQTP